MTQDSIIDHSIQIITNISLRQKKKRNLMEKSPLFNKREDEQKGFKTQKTSKAQEEGILRNSPISGTLNSSKVSSLSGEFEDEKEVRFSSDNLAECRSTIKQYKSELRRKFGPTMPSFIPPDD
eukprot:jgi/Bigna1/129223/aug1.8_g3931